MDNRNSPPFFSAQIQDDGTQVDAWPTQTLLVSLEQGGINWPSSCRNGTCRTCFCQIVQGEVRYEIEWPGLSAEEKADGYVLPCVAFPCSNLILKAVGSS